MAKEYNIAKAAGRCTACGKQLEPGESFTATLRETPDELVREDYCLSCWETHSRQSSPDVFGVWRSQMPQPNRKKRLFVDDELLINLFERLEGADAASKINLRFVLALVLMRKKLLIYDGTESTTQDRDVWKVHVRGDRTTYRLIDPHMDEEKIAEVSAQLDQILEAEL